MNKTDLNKNEIIDMIGTLSNANGVSGFEDETVALLREHAACLGSVTEDAMRNLYVRRNGNNGARPVLQLDAHTDEVGFMVQSIKPNGTLAFIPLGSWTPASVPAHRVRVRTRGGSYITGVTASKPPHFLKESEKNAAPAIENMVIDIGAVSQREAEEDFGISIGAPVAPDADFSYNAPHDLLLGKAFDCRLGCAALVQTLRLLAGTELDVDITGAFSAQEELGMRGAQITAATVKPDIAIVFEGCPADDNFSDASAVQTALKKGPMLRHMDARMVTNPRFQRFALDTAAELNIPAQEAVRTGGATNGGVIHVHSPAVPVIVVGLPVRFIHTHYGFAAYSDFENAVKLAAAIIKRLNESVIRSF